MKMGVLYSTFDDKFNKSIKCRTKGPYYNKWVYKGIKIKTNEEPPEPMEISNDHI
jgi:hypothetical protein